MQTQHEPLQIDGVAEEEKRGRGHSVRLVRPGILGDIDFGGTEQREWSRSGISETSNIRPVAEREIKAPDLSSVRRKQCYSAERSIVVDGDIEQRPSRALEESFHVDLAL